MKTTVLLATAFAAALALSPALACPADTSLEDGPAPSHAPPRDADADASTPQACGVRVTGSVTPTRQRGRVVSCPDPFARRPAERRDAA